MNPTIFLDLDDALIQSLSSAGRTNPGKRTLIRFESDAYFVMERPLAKQMIADCKAVSDVSLLTTATGEYARAVCGKFEFGIETIIAREDLFADEENTGASKTDYCPSSVLVDNQHPREFSARVKRQFLGISEDQYFRIREFNGKDPAKFLDEWNATLESIKTKMAVFSCDTLHGRCRGAKDDGAMRKIAVI